MAYSMPFLDLSHQYGRSHRLQPSANRLDPNSPVTLGVYLKLERSLVVVVVDGVAAHTKLIRPGVRGEAAAEQVDIDYEVPR
jgi:hypothetical protein